MQHYKIFTMFRLALSRLPTYAPTATRAFSTSLASRSVVGKTKEVLSKANEKVGKVLADGIDTAETTAKKASENVPNPKEALDITNKKVGEVLADGIETAESVTKDAPSAQEALNKAGNKAEEAKETLGKKAENAKETLGDKAEEAKETLGDKAEDVKDSAVQAKERARVEANHAGYESLADKGSKVELEQQRPDDAVGR